MKRKKVKNFYIDRSTNTKVLEGSVKGASFLYKNMFGKIVLKLATKRFTSSVCGKYMNTKLSRKHINGFIKDKNIDMREFSTEEYKSFNDFFSRRINIENRPLNKDSNLFLSPCDSKILAYRVNDSQKILIKEKYYTISSILRDKELAKEYENGYFLVFRLATNDYHRYYFIDDGDVSLVKEIKGKYHTVGPVAFEKHKVYEENHRVINVLETKHFGKMIDIEVGALLVGKIVNNNVTKFKRGDEKGYFLFGGSTVVLIVKDGVIKLDDDILLNSSNGLETKVKLFEKIGVKL